MNDQIISLAKKQQICIDEIESFIDSEVDDDENTKEDVLIIVKDIIEHHFSKVSLSDFMSITRQE